MMGVGPTDGTQAPGILEQRGVQSAGTFLVSGDRWRPRRSASQRPLTRPLRAAVRVNRYSPG